MLNGKMLLNEDVEGLKVGPRGDFENKRRTCRTCEKCTNQGVDEAQQKKGYKKKKKKKKCYMNTLLLCYSHPTHCMCILF